MSSKKMEKREREREKSEGPDQQIHHLNYRNSRKERTENRREEIINRMIQVYFPEVRGTECPTQQIASHQDISLPFQNTGDKERFRDREKFTR